MRFSTLSTHSKRFLLCPSSFLSETSTSPKKICGISSLCNGKLSCTKPINIKKYSCSIPSIVQSQNISSPLSQRLKSFPLNFSRRAIASTSKNQCRKDDNLVMDEEEGKDVNVGKEIAVIGGNGYIGGHIIQSLLARDDIEKIISISRSGLPSTHPYMKEAWAHDERIHWLKGDLFDPESFKNLLVGKNGVISAVGAFGNNQTMERFNGDANINAAKTASEAGVKTFVYLSTSENNLPEAFLKGYFNGKKRAEETVLKVYGKNGYILRPSFVYGSRKLTINGKIISLPLEYVGRPLEMLFRLPPFPTLKDSLPGAKALLVPPISVKAVSNVAAMCACNDLDEGGILTVEDIAFLSRSA